MKFKTVLPDRKNFRRINGTEAWPYQWEDKDSPQFRIRAKSPDIWNKTVIVMFSHARNKGDATEFTGRVDLKIFPDGDDYIAATKLTREVEKTKVVHTVAPSYYFAATPIPATPGDRIGRFLIYTALVLEGGNGSSRP